MSLKRIVSAAVLLAVTTPALATPSLTLYPEHIGAETARYYRGAAAVLLQTPSGSVEIRPVPVEKGRIAFAIAVFNQSGRPANFGTENVYAMVDGVGVAVPTHDQLADDAERKARNAKIGTALFAGVLAGVASTASIHHSYQQNVYTPHGSYSRSISWHDDTPGILGATAAVAGGALVIHGIDKKLDYTLDQLNSQILETTTVDPGSTFGGLVVVPDQGKHAYPQEIALQIQWNGVTYPFAFRLTPSGLNVPPPFPATAQDAAMPYRPEQPAMPPAPSPYAR